MSDQPAATSWDALPEEIREQLEGFANTYADEWSGPEHFEAGRNALASFLFPYLRDAERMREIERQGHEA